MNLQQGSENEFIVGWCPICNQGWQVIIRDTITGKLFVLCEECLSLWINPTDAKTHQKALVGKNDLIEEIPSHEDIEKAGWSRYLMSEKTQE